MTEAGEMILLSAHAATTLMMTGLIWFVQVVHYPLFESVGETGFCAYESRHRQRTTLVVGPLMLIELVTAAWIAIDPPGIVPQSHAWLGLGLVLILWLSTAIVQVPLHRRLCDSFDATAWGRLVMTNWIRTIGWSARSVLALVWLAGGTGS
ncbi:MAG: hypothetical protein ACF8PN_15650 [Phycisphaerales bacterium]